MCQDLLDLLGLLANQAMSATLDFQERQASLDNQDLSGFPEIRVRLDFPVNQVITLLCC